MLQLALPFCLVMSYTMVGTIIGTKEVFVEWMNKLKINLKNRTFCILD